MIPRALLALLLLVPAANVSVFRITGSKGTVCQLLKVPGNTISTAGTCKTSDGLTTVTMPKIVASSESIEITTWGYAEIFCGMAVNPTSLPAAEGTLLDVPPWSIAWTCYNGTTVLPTGHVSWP